MTEILTQYGLFLAKSVTWVVAILFVVGSLFAMIREARQHQPRESLEITLLNDRFQDLADDLRRSILQDDELKKLDKQRKKSKKQRHKPTEPHNTAARSRLFVLSFDGDIQASETDGLREEVSAILQVADKTDEVLLKLESAGGMVHSYGLAASQLQRLRDAGLKLTVSVDKVAASGGYMMACVADRIIAAPFAVLGSIGVVAQLPNFNRALKNRDIDIELHTAGEFKRTLTVLGENTDEGREKFKQELNETHQLFKTFVKENRPLLDVNTVSTGEHWYGSRALSLKLIDAVQTSDDFILEKIKVADAYELHFKRHTRLADRLGSHLSRWMKKSQQDLLTGWAMPR